MDLSNSKVHVLSKPSCCYKVYWVPLYVRNRVRWWPSLYGKNRGNKTIKSIVSKFPITGLPCWHSGWESACQCRGHGFKPWFGKIPHTVEQLGPWATITEPVRLEPVLRNKRGHDGERPVHRDEEWPPLAATRESPRTETKTQDSHK